MFQRPETAREITIDNKELFPFIISLLEEGHTVKLKLKGFSMRPFLENERDCALLRKAEDVVLWEPVLAEVEKGRFVLHRIVDIQGDEVTLLGDGNLSKESCKKEDIKAQVVGFYRKGSEKLTTLDSKKWRIYSHIWIHLRPIRRYLLAIYRRII